MKLIGPQTLRFVAVACALAAAPGVGSAAGGSPAPAGGAAPSAGSASGAASGTASGAAELRTPESFAGIKDRDERARAIFLEASRVLLHPRCRNCHPAGDSPAQGEGGQLHDPPVVRGSEDKGVPGLECTSCHQDRNATLARIPGAPMWHLAPRSMAWVGRTPGAICEQIKDPARNGNKTLAQIVEHSAHDELVAWGWNPGADRKPAPGTQERFGALMAAWAKDGAACPREGAKR